MPQVSDKELMMSNTLMIQPEYREQFLSSLQSKWVLCSEQPPNNAADGLKLLVLRSSFFSAGSVKSGLYNGTPNAVLGYVSTHASKFLPQGFSADLDDIPPNCR